MSYKSKDNKSNYKDNKSNYRDNRDSKDSKNYRDNRDSRDSKNYRNNRDSKDSRDRDSKDSRDRDSKDSRDRDSKDSRDTLSKVNIVTPKNSRLLSVYDKNKVAYINLNYKKKYWDEFKRRIFLALQKYNSSSKTKIVYNLNEKNLIEMITFADNFDNLGLTFFKDNNLHHIYLKSSIFADFIDSKSIDFLMIEINKTFEKLDNERNLISDYQFHNIEKIEKKLDELFNNFLDAFDYMKIIDGVYYLYIRGLTNKIFLTHPSLKTKIIFEMKNIFKELFIKIYNKTTRVPIDKEVTMKFDIISTYLVLNYYASLNQRGVLNKIKHQFGQGAVDTLQKSKHLNMEKFTNIVDIMFESEIFKIQKTFFDTMMRKYLGESGYKYIQESLVDAVSYFSSINNKNVLFNITSLFPDKQKHLEELVLNFKRNISLVEVNPKIKS